MEHILDIIMIPIQVIIVFYSLYYFILACFGLMKRRERITVAPKNTFAAVICAHNEEKVVWQLIDNLKQLHYPKDMYDIYVVADNCTDHTADICREHGAIVKVRTNKEQVGKGYALTGCSRRCWPRRSSMTPSSSSMRTTWSIRNSCGK